MGTARTHRPVKQVGTGFSGLFVTFEGLDGAGKTTQVSRVAEALYRKQIDVIQTKEPGGTAAANRIRSVLLDPELKGMSHWAELFLVLAARADHVQQQIAPALKRGCLVISDRFSDSTRAYQIGGRGLERHTVESLISLAEDGYSPDLTFFLDVPLEERKRRMADEGRTLDRFEADAGSMQAAGEAEFRKLAEAQPSRVKRIDGTMGVDKVTTQIMQVIEQRVGGFER